VDSLAKDRAATPSKSAKLLPTTRHTAPNRDD
jgi:hypothetical protein